MVNDLSLPYHSRYDKNLIHPKLILYNEYISVTYNMAPVWNIQVKRPEPSKWPSTDNIFFCFARSKATPIKTLLEAFFETHNKESISRNAIEISQ